MGNCFNKNSDAFPPGDEAIDEQPRPAKGEDGKLNNLLVMAEEEIKTYSGHGGLPNLVSLAEEESRNIKSPERVKSSVGKYEEILSSPTQSHKSPQNKTPSATPEITISLAAFDPEDSHLFDSDRARLVMIDEFSEEEVQEEDEDSQASPAMISPPPDSAPIATAD